MIVVLVVAALWHSIPPAADTPRAVRHDRLSHAVAARTLPR
jgi:hypothetical protein